MGHPEVPEGTPYPADGPERISRSDMALLRRAARERWGTPEVSRNEAQYQLLTILADERASRRSKIAAARTLEAFDRADQRDEIARARLELERERLALARERLAAKAEADADHAETVDPDDAARALKALNGGDADEQPD